MQKYKSRKIKDDAYVAKLEKRQLIKEVRMLSKALVQSERDCKHTSDKFKAQIKRYKCDKLEAEFRLKNCLRRQRELESENKKLLKTIQ